VTLTESDLSELLAALKAGEFSDRVRSSLEWILQQLIEAEATATIGAAPYERAEGRLTQRNGHRPRLLATPAGDVELAIPKLREGSFFPSLLERRRRIDRALYAVVMEVYVHGVSTRKVDDLVKALGAASGISKSEVSRICAALDKDLGAFRTPAPRPQRVRLGLRRCHLRERKGRGPGGLPGRRHRHRGHGPWGPRGPWHRGR
jgi:putative transposase